MAENKGPNGWLIIDKPAGPTSAQVVGKLKWALRQGGYGAPRIGHGGTLDALATGVLPIAIGEATKLTGFLLNGNKSYRFTVAFGTETDSGDADGAVTDVSPHLPDQAAIRAALPAFLGPIRQRPPVYSALKLAGRRASDRARAGEAVELAERPITIHSLDLMNADERSASFEVACSKGTYVRSLARDLARAAGTVGHVTALRRTGAGPFAEAAALPLDSAVQLVHGAALEQALLPLTAGLDDIPALAVEPDEALALKQGRRLSGPRVPPGQYLATLGPVPVALVEVSGTDVRVLRGFNV